MSKTGKLTVRTIVATAIGAALFFVLGRFIAIPSPVPNTTISIQYGLLAFVAGVFGPIAGLLSGIIGHFFIDFSYGWGVWWSWVIASSAFGFLMGLLKRKLDLESGVFGGKKIFLFNAGQAVCHLVVWGAVAPLLDILIYAEPANKVFTQGLVAGAANIVTTAVIGTLLCVAYTAAIPKKGSLTVEKDDDKA